MSELELYTSEHLKCHFRTNQNILDWTAQSTPPRQLTGKDHDSRFNSKTAHAVGKLDNNKPTTSSDVNSAHGTHWPRRRMRDSLTQRPS
ncbi:unnamed protein product [Polarella glacialis]|uniref:Uncharacterized protein n=1 Tax=Polarella glacialis TaxID=89957 RepID=A0A813FD20_POLGL|nr:unnamed protein product [Polarella glacialis]